MKDDLKKRRLILIASTVGLLAFFGFATYWLMGEVASSRARYIEKYRELVSLEQKQEQVEFLEKELAKTVEEREELMKVLVAQTFEAEQQLIIEFENMAKSLGLGYGLGIEKEVTSEDIRLEREAIARSRRGSEDSRRESIEEKFPGVTLRVSLTGEYAKVIEFLETVQDLPYYTFFESLNISSAKRAEEGQRSIASATVLVTVFMRE